MEVARSEVLRVKEDVEALAFQQQLQQLREVRAAKAAVREEDVVHLAVGGCRAREAARFKATGSIEIFSRFLNKQHPLPKQGLKRVGGSEFLTEKYGVVFD